MNGKHRGYVSGFNHLFKEALEEDEITDDCNDAVDYVEDGEDEREVVGAHGPLALAQNSDVVVQPFHVNVGGVRRQGDL